MTKRDRGKTYRCNWQKTRGGVSAWLVADPSVLVQASEFNAAYEELWSLICQRFGDGEAFLEFESPPPRDEKFRRFAEPPCVTLETNVVIDFDGNFSDLYEKGVCPNCRSPIGRRNCTPLCLGKRPSADMALVRNEQSSTAIFSRAFIDLLQLRQHRIELQPVAFSLARGGEYYEITDADALKACGVRTFERMEVRKGFQCRRCGRRSINYIIPKFPAHVFVARESLPNDDVFMVDGGEGPSLLSICMRAEKWKKLRSKLGIRGIVTGLLGIVPPSEVVAAPRLDKA